MQKQPILLLCLSFILGIFWQDFILLNFFVLLILLGVCFLFLFIFLAKNYFLQHLRPFSLLLLFFFLGSFAHFLNSKKPKLPPLHAKETVVFKISKKLNSNEKNRRYEIVAWKDDASFQSILSLPKSESELDFLHYYRGEVYFNKIEKPYSDFQFDYGKYLSRKGIYFQAYITNSLQRKNRDDLGFVEKIRQKRLEILHKIDEARLSKTSREFAKGIILADRTEMDKEIVQDFSTSGLAHILAISGTHMAVIFWLILLLLNPVFPPKMRNYKIILALVLIWSFAIFIDFGSSVIRSCVMISAYYLFILLQRKTDILHAMAIAAFAILIFNTNQLFEVGFQLSFLAVLGIFWLNKPILKKLPKARNKFQNSMLNIVSVSFAAQIATLPLVIFYFHQYSFISIIANLVILPFSEILIVFSLLMALLLTISLQFSWLNFLFDTSISLVLKLIHIFAEIDFVSFQMIPITLIEIIAIVPIIYFLRFAILKFNFKSGSSLTYFVLVFIALRFALNYKAAQINEVLVHRFFKTKIISIKNKKKVQFIVQSQVNNGKVLKYIIEPYLISRRTRDFEIVEIPENIKNIKIGGKTYDFK